MVFIDSDVLAGRSLFSIVPHRLLQFPEYGDTTINLFFFFLFLQPHLWHMEVPGLGVELEFQLLAYTTAMATPDPSEMHLQPMLQPVAMPDP